MHFDMVQHQTFEVELLTRAHASQVSHDVTAVVLEQHAIPLAQLVVVQVQTGIL